MSKKSHSVINIISRVSSFAIGVPVAAMVILLSVFNGFEDLVKQMYTDFDPDIAVVAAEGKVFQRNALDKQKIYQVEGVELVSEILEDNALLEYKGRQYIGMVRGVDSLYHKVVPIEKMVVAGEYDLKLGDYDQSLVGQGLAYNLGVRAGLIDPIKVLVPRRGSFSTLLPIDSYREGIVWPEGIFALDAETDSKYMLAPIGFTQELLNYPDELTAYMVKLEKGANHKKIRTELSQTLGDEYKVLTRYQQKMSLYKMMTYEKWGIFAIILMVMIIASFSIVGSLVMLIIDKKEDIKTIITVGGSVKFVRSIFVKEGMLISIIGAMAGLVLGLLFCWVQMTFGLIKIPADTFLIDSYPVVVKVMDLVVVVVAFLIVSYLITKFTVRKMVPKSNIHISVQ